MLLVLDKREKVDLKLMTKVSESSVTTTKETCSISNLTIIPKEKKLFTE